MSGRRAPWFGLLGRRLMIDLSVAIAVATLAGVAFFEIGNLVELGNIFIDTVKTRDLIELAVFGLPAVVQRVLPMAAPLGALTAVGTLARRSELSAQFAAGASPAIVLKPVLLVGLGIAAIDTTLVELALPASMPRVLEVRKRIGLVEWGLDRIGRQSWYKGERYLYRVGAPLAGDGSVLGDVTMLRVEAGRLLERWDLERLSFEGGEWIGSGVTFRSVGAGEALEQWRKARAAIALHEQPKDFVSGVGRPVMLPRAALREMAESRDRLGLPSQAAWLELYQRRMAPIRLMLSIALGAALAIRLGRRQSLAAGIGFGAAIGMLLWYLRELERLLGLSGRMDPLLATHLLPALLCGLTALVWVQAFLRGPAER